jgi:uncharacterized membrane protein
MRRLLRWSPRRRRDERGIVAVALAIIICFTLVPLAAYAVDIGVQRVARRDVQVVADMVALDLARQLDGRSYSQLQGTLQALANKSAARNSAGTAVAVVVPELGKVDESAYNPSNPGAYFTPITSNAGGIPNAVRVTASTSVDFALHGGSGGVNRTSIAKARASACFDVGSFALNLDSSKSALLNSLIGDSLNLSALSYTGLANANVTLLGLATALGVGSVDGLLGLDITLNQLYLASAQALQKSGGDAADIALLNQLATANLGALPHIKISDLFDLQSGDNAALSTSINLLDLVSTSAFVANGTNALAIPNLTVGIPNVTGVTASLKVIEKPQRGCVFNHVVKTSQVDLSIHVDVVNLNILLLAATTSIDISLNLASADAIMTNAICGNPEGIDVSVASALSKLTVTTNVFLKLLGLTILSVNPTVGSVVSPATNLVQFRHPPDAYGTPKSVGSNVIAPSLTLTDLNNNNTPSGSLPFPLTLSGVLSTVMSTIVTPIVNPLIANLNTLLIAPLADLLGLKLGGADIYAIDHPTCNNPALAG